MKTRKLSCFLAKWCKDNGFDVSVQFGSEFACYPMGSKIRYTLMTDVEQSMILSKVFEDEGLVNHYDIFILSFFHELGHFETDDMWTDEESMRFERKKSILNGNVAEDNFKYSYIEDEITATRWAIDYINSHENEISKLWQRVRELVFEIYYDLGYREEDDK